MNVLELMDVSIIYQNTKEAVKHVSFAVPEGKIVAIVGESGSGKSTLIRAAIGLLPAGGELASGQILFGEKDMAAMTAEELRHVRGEGIAMIFQNAGDYLNPRRKVCDQYVETLRCHQKISKKEGYEAAKKMLGHAETAGYKACDECLSFSAVRRYETACGHCHGDEHAPEIAAGG